jgi:putative spermidine/putrescine transport system permease protein
VIVLADRVTPKRVWNLSAYLLVLPALIWTLIFLIGPLLEIALMSFYTPIQLSYVPIFTLSNYVQTFTDPTVQASIALTLEYSTIVAVASVLLAFPAAYFMANKIQSQTLKTAILVALIIPFWIDWTIRTISWIPMLGTEGIVNDILIGLHILSKPSPLFLYSDFATVLVMIQSYVVFVIGPIFLALAKIDPILYEAAAACGANRIKQFYNITLRLSLPGVAIGAAFVFVASMGDWATPKVIGRIATTAGQFIYNSQVYLNWPLASAVSVVITGIAIVIVILLFSGVKLRQFF